MSKGERMKELLPCPFCGGKPVSDRVYMCGNGWIVYCAKCGAEIFEEAGFSSTDIAKQAAIDAWNTRTPKQENWR